MKNTAKILLTLMVAISVFLLNFGNFIQCSMPQSQEDCCHIIKSVKSCCAENTKINLNERISSHCGCSVEQSNKPGDLYSDLKNNSSNLNFRFIQYTDLSVSAEQNKTSIIFTSYSPPVYYMADTYLNILSLRI
ncbi:MAG: hypothetical protein IT280_10070 [Ignavibacteria bacterium]|nr:hypothetical protein [Ignavibacteria bacterium]